MLTTPYIDTRIIKNDPSKINKKKGQFGHNDTKRTKERW